MDSTINIFQKNKMDKTWSDNIVKNGNLIILRLMGKKIIKNSKIIILSHYK